MLSQRIGMEIERKPATGWKNRILSAPETNLFLFAFLLNFVYEVWQSPYYTFYNSPAFADKIRALTHCTVGDGAILLVCYWVIGALVGSRFWILKSTRKLTVLFTCLGLFFTLIYESYRVNVIKVYGVPAFAVPGLGISALAVLQWVILPPLVLSLARRQSLGYQAERLVLLLQDRQDHPNRCVGDVRDGSSVKK
jgi:hypothetical protein